MTRNKQRISLIAKHLLCNDPNYWFTDTVAYGDLDIIHEIFDRSGFTLKTPHPLNVIKRVMDALSRESKLPNPVFVQHYFRADRGLARMFVLTGRHQQEWQYKYKHRLDV